MNNDAFRALINKQRQPTKANKSTKEIAREAVENEFQKKRRRGGGSGRRGRGGYDNDAYGSDSGGSSDEDVNQGRGLGKDSKKQQGGEEEQEDDNHLPEWKRRRREKRRQDGGGASEYRDRAKERREGTNSDYASLQGLATQPSEDDRRRQAELSKYLGGDEEHTHLVKGLDKALAEKVRREEMGQDGPHDAGDLDQLLEDAYAQKKGQSTSKQTQSWQTLKPKTELGKSVLSHLLQKKKAETALKSPAQLTNVNIRSNATIQRSIQRSILTFSLDSDVRRRKDAWEVPQMSVRASSSSSTQETMATTSRRATPLNHHMIATITKKLDEGLSRGKKEMSKYHVRAEKTNNGTKSGHATNNCEEITSRNGDAHPNSNITKENGKGNGKAVKKDDDSDDDIFENIGTYVPQALSSKPEEPATAATFNDATDANDKGDKQNTDNNDSDDDDNNNNNKILRKEKKQSIFDNLIPETSAPPPINLPKSDLNKQHQHQRHQEQQQNTSKRKNKNVINRDILGGQPSGDKDSSSSQQYVKRRGPKSASMEGVSMTSYQGGYGEEMDVDFGGDEWEKERRRQRKEKEEENSGGEGDDREDDMDDED